MGRPTGWWSGPPHICSAGAAAASAARIGCRSGSTADRAGRLSAAGIAAPLLNKVRERKAAEAAVAGRSHSVFLQKKIWEHPFPCHSMPHVPDACRKTEKPGRHTVVRVLDTKIEKKTQRLENCDARRAAFKPYFFLSFILGSRVRKPAAFSVARNSGLTPSSARATP